MSHFNFIKTPKISNVGGVKRYVWNGLEIRMTHKGRSVFAVQPIESETFLPYGGVELNESKYKEVSKIDDDCRWLVDGQKNSDEEGSNLALG